MSKMKRTLDYRNKVILAPMVRIGTLPTRLVALDYGADIVYTEEIIDLKMLQSKRVVNDMLGTVDFVMEDETLAFRTCKKERERVVFQIGTADAQRALKVGKMIEEDVAAIDLNMGCPKEYSTKGGMGAALLSTPETVKEILTTLVNNLSIPVTCKMRLLPTVEETIDFVKMLEATGVAAIAVHGRYRDERPRHPVHSDLIKLIAETVSIPVIANGGSKHVIKKYEDIETFRQSCGAASVMIARAVQWDPSLFRPSGAVPIEETVKLYVKYALEYDSSPTNIKYNVQQLLHTEMETPHGKALAAAGTMYEISSIWGLDQFYAEKVEAWAEHRKHNMTLCKPKKRKLDDGSEIWEMEFRYYKREYTANVTPKFMLDQWTRQTGRDKPVYDTQENVLKQYFYTVLTIDGVKYASTLWDKSKKASEQSAAAVFLMLHDLPDGRKEWPSQNRKNPNKLENDTSLKHKGEVAGPTAKPGSGSDVPEGSSQLVTTTGASATSAPSTDIPATTPATPPAPSPNTLCSLPVECKTDKTDTRDGQTDSKLTTTTVDESEPSSAQESGETRAASAGQSVQSPGVGTSSAASESPSLSTTASAATIASTSKMTSLGEMSGMAPPQFTMTSEMPSKANMTLLIDDIIEKQIRLSQDEPNDNPSDCSLVNSFIANDLTK